MGKTDLCTSPDSDDVFYRETTSKSSIMKVFPKWADYLNVEAIAQRGLISKLHDTPENYREAVRFIKEDPHSLRARQTTHKIDLLKACKDMFDELDPYAMLMDAGNQQHLKTSMANWSDMPKIPFPAVWRLKLDGKLLKKYRGRNSADGRRRRNNRINLLSDEAGTWRQQTIKIYVTNRSTGRLKENQRIHHQLHSDVTVEYIHAPVPEQNDAVAAKLKPASLVANATGLGKDAPGSLLTDAAIFPEHGIVWDFNYRGTCFFSIRRAPSSSSATFRLKTAGSFPGTAGSR